MTKDTTPKVVLAYSGGLDTTIAIKWLQDNYGVDVIAACVDVGQAEDLEGHAARAQAAGAKAVIIGARSEFVKDYIVPALKANLLYEGVYPAGTALARPLICEKLVELARKEGAKYLAHGCTAKGNDQVRFEACFAVLAPDLKVLAPMREWPVSRQEELEYAATHGLDVPINKDSPYSVDENLWGRSVECGPLEDPWCEPPEDAFEWTVSPMDAPDEPVAVTISFDKGVPSALDGVPMDPEGIIDHLNLLASEHGVGRIDHIENRVVGIKSREVYEYPAATVLIQAHKALEKHVLSKDMTDFKVQVENQLAEMVYRGLWSTPFTGALQAFVDSTQGTVTGEVMVKLFKGSSTVVGSRSEHSIYQKDLSTYGAEDGFDHGAAAGFLEIYTLPLKVMAQAQKMTMTTAPTVEVEEADIKKAMVAAEKSAGKI